MYKLKVVVGLPRSGKSTYVNSSKQPGEIIVSTDRLNLLIYGQRYYSGGEAMLQAIKEIQLKSLMEQGLDITIDDSNITVAARAKLLNLANTYNYEASAVFIDASIMTCIERARAADQLILVSAINKAASQLEFPKVEEGFKSIWIINMQ
jgi:predicted kinase